MEMGPASTGRMVVALVVLGVVSLSVWMTMDEGKYRTLTFVLLGFFGARILLGWLRAGREREL